MKRQFLKAVPENEHNTESATHSSPRRNLQSAMTNTFPRSLSTAPSISQAFHLNNNTEQTCQLLATMDDDSPWADDANILRDSEWSKISSDFLNVRCTRIKYVRLSKFRFQIRSATVKASLQAKREHSKRASTRAMRRQVHRWDVR